MVALIWDLDGTLLDSYEAILAGIKETYAHYQLPFEKEEIRKYILRYSVQALLEKDAATYGLDASELNRVRTKSLQEKNAQIHLMDGAREVLDWAKKKEIQQFVYTHKGANAHAILEDFGISAYFTEVITSVDGFKRKPDPEGIVYLVDKYQLDKEQTYYIGDRLLDIEAALNSGIQSINFHSFPSLHHHSMTHLRDICFYLK